MERQRSPASCSSSYHCHLLSPKSLILFSLASLSLLSCFLLALRQGRPLHLPLAFAAAPAPVLVGGGGYWGDPAATEVEEAVVGLRRGDSVAEGDRPADPGDSGVGLVTEAQETTTGRGNGEAFSDGEVSKGQEVGEKGARGGHWESPDNSTLGNNPGATPVNPNEQESAKSNIDYAQSNTAQCDVSDGSWVFDESYPLYESNSCPFIDEGFSCQANGRMDQSYMKMRWQPKHCNIPRFDARKMLEMLRGKRLVFVGDFINRNQWESMTCLLRMAIPDSSRIREARGRNITKGTIIALWSIIRHTSWCMKPRQELAKGAQ